MKNKLSDLNNHLFAQMERLSDEDLSVENIKTEVSRAEAIVKVSDQIIQNANVCLKATKMIADGYGTTDKDGIMPLIGSNSA